MKFAPHTKDLRISKTLILSSSVKSPNFQNPNLPKSEQNAFGMMGFSSSSSRRSLNKRVLCNANLAADGGIEDNQRLAFPVGLFAFGLALCKKISQYIATGLIILKDLVENVRFGWYLRNKKIFYVGETIMVEIKEDEVYLEGQVEEIRYTKTLLRTDGKLVTIPHSVLKGKIIENKTRSFGILPISVLARESFRIVSEPIVKKIYLPIDNFGKISKISEDIKSMLRSKSYFYLESEGPSCCVSKIDNTYAELTIRCDVDYKELMQDRKKIEHDFHSEVLRIIEEHGV